MNKSFPKEKYQEICRGLQPSRESVREVITMKEPKKYSRIKRKTFVGAAACVTLIFSLSVGVVAATNGDIVQNATNQLIIWYENLTIDKEASTPKETVTYTEDGTEIRVVHGYGENGEYYVTLVYHADSGRLGLTIGEEEFDITEELQRNGTYTKEYSYDGRNYKAVVTGTPEKAELATEEIGK